MIEAVDIIDRLPFELQARLEADGFFVDVPVVVAEEGNIRLEMERRQAVVTNKGGKRGAAVVVLQVVADDDFPNLQFGPMTMYPSFQVIENLELNRDANGTGKSARRIARRVRDVIKCFGATGLVKNMTADKPCIVPVVVGREVGELVRSYAVNFRCLEVSTQDMAQVQTPAMVREAGVVTISCGTAGATVYYTVDESYPRPGNGAVYGGPVLAAAQMVRACGYADGMVASWVAGV